MSEIKRTRAVHEIGRINQRANLEGAHNGERKASHCHQHSQRQRKQHLTPSCLATYLSGAPNLTGVDCSLPPQSTQCSLISYCSPPTSDMWISLYGYSTMVEPQFPLLLYSKILMFTSTVIYYCTQFLVLYLLLIYS